MKKFVILVAVLVMVFALTIPAAASGFGPGGGMGSATTGGQPGGRGTFVIVGKITEIGSRLSYYRCAARQQVGPADHRNSSNLEGNRPDVHLIQEWLNDYPDQL